MSQASALNISNIGNGVVSERFDHELKKIVANLRDINTDAKKPREISIKIKFIPHGDRVGMSTTVEVSSKLASIPAAQTGAVFMLKNDANDLNLYSHDIRQEDLFPEKPAETPANVVSMAKQA